MIVQPKVSQPETHRGARDWKQKLVVIRAVLGVIAGGDIADKIFDDVEKSSRVAGKMRTWHRHSPTTKESIEFFDRLVQEMGCVKGTTGTQLINSSIERFLELLDPEDQAIGREALEAAGVSRGPGGTSGGVRFEGFDGIFPPGPRRTPANFRNVLVPRRGRLETISAGIRGGRINEKHYYLTPEAAVTWNELINAESYPTYDYCKSGLKALMLSAQWKAAVAERPVTAAVMLCGGGSPSKDLVLIRGLLDQPLPGDPSIDYVILDISPYMLLSSMWWLEETLETISDGGRVNLIPVCEDVRTSFDRSAFDRGAGRTMFGITGGTIGNLNEADFFRRVPAETGDLLIVSADSLPADDPSNVQCLIDKYSHREMHKFVAPAIHALIRDFDLQESFAKVYELVEVRVAEGELANSDVPGSASVTLKANVGGRDITILSSTRYVHDELVKFAAQFGWIHRHSVTSPSSENFTQFLFEKE